MTHVCHTTQKPLICESCIRKHVAQHESLENRYRTSRNQLEAKATSFLNQIGHSTREKHAAAFKHRSAVQETRNKIVDLRKKLQKDKAQIASRRSIVLQGHQRLLKARELINPCLPASDDPFITEPPTPQYEAHTQLDRLHAEASYWRQRWQAATKDIASERRTLVEALFKIYSVRIVEEDDDREAHVMCTIANALLPQIIDIKRYPPDEVCAAVSHCTHLVRLLAVYLGIFLPFAITVAPKLTIKATSLSTWSVKYAIKYPLYISSSLVDQNEQSSFHKAVSYRVQNGSRKMPSLQPFITSLTMLNYNVACICAALQTTYSPTQGMLFALLSIFAKDGPLHIKSHSTVANRLEHTSLAVTENLSLDFGSMFDANLARLAKAETKAKDEEWSVI